MSARRSVSNGLANAVALMISDIFSALRLRKKRKQIAKIQSELDLLHQVEYKNWVKNNSIDGETLHLSPIPTDNVILSDGEQVFWIEKKANLVEGRAVRITSFSGVSIPVIHGMRVARGMSVSQSHEESRIVSSGTLAITNQRLIFHGNYQNREFPLTAISGLGWDDSELYIHASTRQKTMCFQRINGRICITIIRGILAS